MTRHVIDSRPLTWQSLTGPSRVMVPYYLALTVTAGLVYLFDPQGRVARNDGLTAARLVVHGRMGLWGLLFLTLAAGIVWAFVLRRRTLLVVTLYCASAVTFLWTLFTAWSVIINPDVSFVGPLWVLGTALACRATARSVLVREIPRGPVADA